MTGIEKAIQNLEQGLLLEERLDFQNDNFQLEKDRDSTRSHSFSFRTYRCYAT